MMGQQTKGCRWSDGREGALEMLAAAQPHRSSVQLLRSVARPGLELGGDAHEHLPGLVEVGVLAGEPDRGLAGVLGPSADHLSDLVQMIAATLGGAGTPAHAGNQ